MNHTLRYQGSIHLNLRSLQAATIIRVRVFLVTNLMEYENYNFVTYRQFWTISILIMFLEQKLFYIFGSTHFIQNQLYLKYVCLYNLKKAVVNQ